LDYGCGTGILAILATKLAADTVQAIDYDPLSYENTLENIEKNQSIGIQTILGELDKISGILQTDESLVTTHIKKAGFVVVDILSKGEWLCMKLKKQG